MAGFCNPAEWADENHSSNMVIANSDMMNILKTEISGERFITEAGFKPCWSCEGHDAADGRLWKVPRVWFYADSMVHVRVLAEALASLSAGGVNHVPWRVRVTHTDDANPDTVFSLVPDLSGNAGAGLNDLQRDTGTIAEHLEVTILTESQRILSTI